MLTKTSEEKDAEYLSRFNNPFSVKTHLSIKPIFQPKTFELFYNISENRFNNSDKIRANQIKLANLYDNLPMVAKDKFLIEMISEELKSSNDLEGIESSKEQIVETAKKIVDNQRPRDRFHSMIHSYLELFKGSLPLPEECKDIRKIYDYITEGEIRKR